MLVVCVAANLPNLRHRQSRCGARRRSRRRFAVRGSCFGSSSSQKRRLDGADRRLDTHTGGGPATGYEACGHADADSAVARRRNSEPERTRQERTSEATFGRPLDRNVLHAIDHLRLSPPRGALSRMAPHSARRYTRGLLSPNRRSPHLDPRRRAPVPADPSERALPKCQFSHGFMKPSEDCTSLSTHSSSNPALRGTAGGSASRASPHEPWRTGSPAILLVTA